MDPLGWLAGHLTLAAVVLGIAAALGALAGLLARVGIGPQDSGFTRAVGWVLIFALAAAVSFALISIFF